MILYRGLKSGDSVVDAVTHTHTRSGARAECISWDAGQCALTTRTNDNSRAIRACCLACNCDPL